MSEREKISGARRHRRKLMVLLVLLAISFASLLYLRSDSFKQSVKRRLIAEIERATGGRVEIGRFDWSLSELGAVGEDITVHGLEAKGDPPLAHLGRIAIRAKVFSWIGREFGLSQVAVTRPTINITVYPDGTSNVPSPGRGRAAGGARPIDTLFRLQIDDFAIADGEVVWNHERIPLAVTATNVRANLNYVPAEDRYDGKLSAGAVVLRYKNAQSLPAHSEISFRLLQNRLQLTSLAMESTRSRIEGEGQVADLREPALDVSYRGQIDFAEWAPIFGLRTVRSGVGTVTGTGSVSAKGYSTETRATVSSLHFVHGKIQVQGATAAANVLFDGKRFEVRSLVAQMLGGVVKGRVTLNGLETSDISKQKGRIELETQGLDLPAVIAAAPLDVVRGLKVAGSVSGPVNAAWQGDPGNTAADFDLRIDGPATAKDDQIPVSGQVRGTFAMRGERLELLQADLTTPSTTVHAGGVLGGQHAEMNLTAETSRLAELNPLIRNIAGDQGLPITVQGKATFRGTISGALNSPGVKGSLQLTDFEHTLGRGDGAEKTANVHWDAFQADIDYSPQSLSVKNGELRRGAAAIGFSGHASLTKGRFTDLNEFQLRAQIRNLLLEDAQIALLGGIQYPVTGAMNLDIDASGTAVSPRGSGKLRIENGTIYGEPVRSLTANLHLAGKQVSAENIVIAQNGGRLTGSGMYDTGTERFAFTANGAGFDMAHFKSLENSFATLGGIANISATGEGTMAAPAIEGKLKVDNFSVNGEALGDFTAEATTHGRDLQLHAQSAFRNSALKLDGTARLAGDFPAQGTIHLTDFNLDSRGIPHLAGKVDGKVAANGTFEFAGPLKAPRSMTLKGELSTVNAVIENVELANDGPILFEIRDQALTLRQFHVKGEGTNLQASGTIGLEGDRRMNFRAQGDANLRLFQGFNRDLQSYGNLALSTSVGGTLAKPELAGRIQIQNGGVAFIDLPNGLSEINGLLIFDQNRLRVQSLSARTGGGLLNIGGYIAFRDGLYFDLTAKGNDIRLRYPEGVSSVANAELHLTGTTRSSLLSGDVLVTKFGINPRFDFALYLARSRQVKDTRAPKNPVLDSMRLDMHVITTADLRVETSLAKVSGDADLRLRGTAADPAVLGRVNIVEGSIFFSGTKYNLERGDILFINPRGIEPVLDLEATARVREYDITIGFHGKPTALGTTYRSEPPLPTADIIALLALGRTRDETRLTNTPEQSLTESAQNAILGQALDAAVSNRVQQLFGVSRIKIDPQVGGPENTTARITIEQQVNQNVTLTYITNLTQVNQQVIQAEFNLNRNVSLVIVRDQNGVLGIDVKVRQRKK